MPERTKSRKVKGFNFYFFSVRKSNVFEKKKQFLNLLNFSNFVESETLKSLIKTKEIVSPTLPQPLETIIIFISRVKTHNKGVLNSILEQCKHKRCWW